MKGAATKLKTLDWVPISCKGKVPVDKGWPDLTKDTTRVRSKYNLGVITGARSLITVIDVDIKDGGVEWFDSYVKEFGDIETPTVKTGSGGYHYYFSYCKELKSVSRVIKGVGIDVKNDGGFVVCPPSVHSSGNEYEWIRDPWSMPLMNIPETLLEKLRKPYVEEPVERESFDSPSEERNHLRRLLGLLNPERRDNYDDWLYVGMTLYSVSEEYCDLWDEWSQKSTKYNSSVIKEKWGSFGNRTKGSKLSIASLHHWVKEDDKEGYKALKKEECIRECAEEYIESIDDIKYQDKKILAVDNSTKHCKLSDCDHMIPSGYLEMLRMDGSVNYGCRDLECFGLSKELGKISVDKLNVMFNVNHLTINNYNGQKEEDEYDLDDIILSDDYELDNYLRECIMSGGKAGDYANILWYLNKDKFNFVGFGDWCDIYYFDGVRWRRDDVYFREWIREELPKIFIRAKDKISNKKGKKTIKQIIDGLKSPAMDKNIKDRVAGIYRSELPDFKNMLDTKKNLLGFKDGVYDLDKDLFREGDSNDYITMSVGYDYPDNCDENKDLIKFLEDIQPDRDQREYLLKFTASCLFGGNKEETFHIFSGSGRNGKSKYADLVRYTFGEYFTSIPSMLLTKEQPSACVPRPELLSIRNMRFALASEPENNHKLNSSFIKLLSGNDQITARNMYESEILSFVAYFSLVLLCNDIPEFDRNDQAIWDRCRCIEFPSRFVDNPKESNEKKIDRDLGDKIKSWHKDFMRLLLSYYKKYKEDGLKAPNSVMKFTQKTQSEGDIYKQYLDERTEEANTHIHTITLWNDFQKWYNDNISKKNEPKKNDFIKGISRYIKIERVRAFVANDSVSRGGIKNLKII